MCMRNICTMILSYSHSVVLIVTTCLHVVSCMLIQAGWSPSLPPGDTEDSRLSSAACLPVAQANGQLPHATEPDAQLQVGWQLCTAIHMFEGCYYYSHLVWYCTQLRHVVTRVMCICVVRGESLVCAHVRTCMWCVCVCMQVLH